MKKTLVLRDLLVIRQEDELLYSNHESAVLISTTAFGTLQRDLIENIGLHRVKSFFFQYGYHLGQEDAIEIAKNESLSMMEKIECGPVMHALKGHAKSRITEKALEMENQTVKSLYFKGVWEKSFEAAQYVRNFGKSPCPVCHTLTGYATGYIKALVGEEVFFKELQCEGEGAPCCIWEGRLLVDWQDEADSFFYTRKELPLIQELEQTNEKLLQEKHTLALVTNIHTDLTDEIIKGNSMDAILEIVNRQTRLPVVVEDAHRQVVALRGISPETYERIKRQIQPASPEKQAIHKPTVCQGKGGTRLVAPIFLLDKIAGYCTFLYEGERTPKYEIDSMIMGRFATICSLLFLKEKTALESMERVKGYFLEEIIRGKYLSAHEIMRKADYLQLDLSDDYHVVFLAYHFTAPCAEQELTLQKHTFEAVSAFFSEKSLHVLIGQQPDSVIILITEKQLHKQGIESVAQALLFFLKKETKHAAFAAGISSRSTNILEAGVAVEEARAAARFSSRNEPVSPFHELGMIGVLINEQNEKAIRKMIRETLGVLYENADSHHMILLETLYQFLLNGGNLEQTADKLALSISGLRYRMNKIADVLGGDLRDPHVQFELLIALKALKIIDHGRLDKIN